MGSICNERITQNDHQVPALLPQRNNHQQLLNKGTIQSQTNNTTIAHVSRNNASTEGSNPQTNVLYNLMTRFGDKPSRSYAQPVNQHFALSAAATQTLTYLKQNGQQSARVPKLTDQIYLIESVPATYQGKFKNGNPHGYGIAHFANGSFYYGEFKFGEAQGKGMYIYPNGSFYDGQFSKEKFNGYGALFYLGERMKYIGNFMNGKPHGEGQQIYYDSSYYVGEFKNGIKSGKGTYKWKNGQIYTGQFKNGLMHGEGKITSNNTVIFQGRFADGMKIGEGLLRTKEGSFYGSFENDYLQGAGTFVWNDGKIYQGMFERSKFHGLGTIYYPSNQVAKGRWANNHNMELHQIYNQSDSSLEHHLNQIRARHGIKNGQSTMMKGNKESTNSEMDYKLRNQPNIIFQYQPNEEYTNQVYVNNRQ